MKSRSNSIAPRRNIPDELACLLKSVTLRGTDTAYGRSAGRNGNVSAPSDAPLVELRIPERQAREWACSSNGYRRIGVLAPIHRALPNAYVARPGLEGFHQLLPAPSGSAERTAGFGPGRGRVRRLPDQL